MVSLERFSINFFNNNINNFNSTFNFLMLYIVYCYLYIIAASNVKFLRRLMEIRLKRRFFKAFLNYQTNKFLKNPKIYILKKLKLLFYLFIIKYFGLNSTIVFFIIFYIHKYYTYCYSDEDYFIYYLYENINKSYNKRMGLLKKYIIHIYHTF